MFLVAVAALALAASAQAKVTDPRKCTISTPAYCASHAAARVAIAKVRAVGAPKPVGFVQAHCNPRGTLLRWACGVNDSGGHGWNVTVRYWGTAAGWRVRAVITASGTG